VKVKETGVTVPKARPGARGVANSSAIETWSLVVKGGVAKVKALPV
jgi:hypothetical protein